MLDGFDHRRNSDRFRLDVGRDGRRFIGRRDDLGSGLAGSIICGGVVGAASMVSTTTVATDGSASMWLSATAEEGDDSPLATTESETGSLVSAVC